jgi:acyl-CoA synthetase (AMP-forming)/AMP-acid ligase II
MSISTGTSTGTSATPVIASAWPDPEVPDISLPDALLGVAAERPRQAAVTDAASGRTLSYGELASAVRRVAAGLAAHGLRPGDTFAILAPNSPEWLVACFGAMAAGGVVTGLNPMCTPGEVAAQLLDSGARFLLTETAFLPTARAAAELTAASRADNRIQVIVTNAKEPGKLDFPALQAHGERLPCGPLDPAALALLPYSSGTTGRAKGVMLSHRAVLTNLMQSLTVMPTGPAARVLAVAPFFHAVGLVVLAGRALLGGATLVTLPRFEVPGFLAALQDHRITQTVVVPPIVQALARHPAVSEYDLSSLEWLGCGAAPLDAGLQQACAERIGCPVGQGYGMTEVTAGLALWPEGTEVVPGSSGRLLPGARARIVEPERQADVAPGETGELWVRTPSVMDGYLGNPAATAATIDSEGWLHTGDIARFSAEGDLFITDRVKELIKVNGFQVAPAELEAVLCGHPRVAAAAVVPVPDERAGERPRAFVVLTEGGRAGAGTAAELIGYVAERVAPYKRITEVEFTDSIPVSPSGKILRRLLRDS